MDSFLKISILLLKILDIEMGRLITASKNSTVLYVSGGNTQVSSL
jgi:hypothetical protein